MSDLEFTSRYEALGIPLPDTETMCKDQCEGTGFVPVSKDDPEEPWATLWKEAEGKKRALADTVGSVLGDDDDGWHFVRCPSCGGTGKRTQ